MNLLIAVVLFGGIFTLYGLPEITPKLSRVSQCVDVERADPTSAPRAPRTSRAPANAAGLKPGDTLVSIAGTKVSTWDDVRKAIRGNLDKPMTIVRTSATASAGLLVAKPLVLDLPVYDDQGQPITDDAGKVETERAGFLGTSATPEIVPQPVTRSPASSGSRSPRMAGSSLNIPREDGGRRQGRVRLG